MSVDRSGRLSPADRHDEYTSMEMQSNLRTELTNS